MKLFSVVLVTLTCTPLVWSAEDSAASQEVNVSKLEELLSSSAESQEKEEDSSQVVLPGEPKPELDPAEGEEEANKDRTKKSYAPGESPYPLDPYPATHHVSHVHSYVAKPAYVPPGPTYASSHIMYSAPPYLHAPPYCIEIRPKVPTQAPFFVCEPPHKAVAPGSPAVQHPAGFIPPYGRADEHQSQSQHQPTTTSPPPPATTLDQTTKAATEKPKEESGSHEQKPEKPAPSPGGSAPRTVYAPSPYYPPGHHGGILPPYLVPHPSAPVKSLPPPYYPPLHPAAYPVAHPAVHPPVYAPTPLILNCQVEPSYAAPPQNPVAMLQLFMRPAPGYSYASYREPAHEDEKKDKKAKTSPKSSGGPSTPDQTHPSNKERDQQGGIMMIPQMRQWSMRADMDQEPTSIGIPLPNGSKMPGEEENQEDCAESLPKMAEAGQMKVPVGSKGQASKESNKTPVNSRMNYYMPGPSMALSPFK